MPTNTLIIGGGIVGAALAFELARRGAAVTLLEAHVLASQATNAALGTLSYAPSSHMPEAWHALAAPSLDAHRTLETRLAENLAQPPRWHWSGRLSLATNNKSEAYVRQRLREDVAAGQPGEWLDKRAIHEREPALAGRVQGGSYKPGHGWVDATALTLGLAGAAQQHGAVVHEHRRVTALRWQGGRVVGAEAGGERFEADATIIAAGLGSATLDPALSAPLHAVRGQALHISLWRSGVETPLVRHLVSGSGIYLIPEGDGVTVGSTHERVAARGNTVGGIAKLLGNAVALLPALGKADWAQAQWWSGLRPATPDKVPILGPDPDHAGLWWATGHFRSGILLAPHSATLLAEALLDGRALDERWSVGRFRAGSGG